MPANAPERVGDNAPGVIECEAQRRLLRPAASRDTENAGPDTDADDRQSAIEKVSGQAQFRAEARNQIAADDALRAGPENNETVIILGAQGNRGARRERPAIAEPDIASLELILKQPEIVRFHVLEDTQCFHASTSIRWAGNCNTLAPRPKNIY